MGFSCQPPVPALLPEPPTPPERQRPLRVTFDFDEMKAEFRGGEGCESANHAALAGLINLALSVGAGVEPRSKLTAALAPYGVRRKEP